MLIRPHVPEDAEAAFELLHEREPILRWLVWDGPRELDELRMYYSRWVVAGEGGNDYHFAVVERDTERLVGSIGVRFTGHPGTGDVGYWLGEPYWGRGYATEAVRLVDHVAFEHLGAQVLCAWVFVGNDASRTVLERNGYSLVRTIHGRVRKGTVAQDEWYLTLLESEWRGGRGTWRPHSLELAPR